MFMWLFKNPNSFLFLVKLKMALACDGIDVFEKCEIKILIAIYFIYQIGDHVKVKFNKTVIL